MALRVPTAQDTACSYVCFNSNPFISLQPFLPCNAVRQFVDMHSHGFPPEHFKGSRLLSWSTTLYAVHLSCLASSGVGRTVGSRWRTLTASIAFSRFRSTLAQHIRHRHWCHMNTIYISLSMYSRSVGDVDLQLLCGLVFQVHNLPKVSKSLVPFAVEVGT